MTEETPLHYIAQFDAKECLMAWFSFGGADTEVRDKEGLTPLASAVKHGSSMVLPLIEMGADLEAKDKFDRTPLMIACRAGKLALVEILLENKAKVDAKTSIGDTPMTFA